MTSRKDVYAAIDSERDYQDMRKHRDSGAEFHSVEEFILYMQHYLTQTISVASTVWGSEAKPATLEILRKVVTLGVACMEQHGAPQRKGFERDPGQSTNKIVFDINHAIEQLEANPELGYRLLQMVVPASNELLKQAEKENLALAERLGTLRTALYAIAYKPMTPGSIIVIARGALGEEEDSPISVASDNCYDVRPPIDDMPF